MYFMNDPHASQLSSSKVGLHYSPGMVLHSDLIDEGIVVEHHHPMGSVSSSVSAADGRVRYQQPMVWSVPAVFDFDLLGCLDCLCQIEQKW